VPPPAARTLFASPDYVVDYLPAPAPSGRVVITFAELGDRRLEGAGFGGEFLLKNGFDVVAIKSAVDRWYQDSPPALFQSINQHLAALPTPHRARAGYGASMGGFAVIAFAATLRLETAYAISPQFDITAPWDRRWHGKLAAPMPQMLTPASLNPACRYAVVYDPADADRLHVERMAAIIPPAQLLALPLPYSGHPAAYTLQQAGYLKPLALAILRGDLHRLDRRAIITALRATPHHPYLLASRCADRGHPAWAASLIATALGRSPLNAEFNIKSGQIAARQGRRADAVRDAAAAVALEPDNPYMNFMLGGFLREAGQTAQALHYIEAALALLPGEAEFARARDALRAP
jgi:hypothetical protein